MPWQTFHSKAALRQAIVGGGVTVQVDGSGGPFLMNGGVQVENRYFSGTLYVEDGKVVQVI